MSFKREEMDELDETTGETPAERPEPIGQCKEVNTSDTTDEDESAAIAKVTPDPVTPNGRHTLDQATIDEMEAERQHSKYSVKRPLFN